VLGAGGKINILEKKEKENLLNVFVTNGLI